MKIGAAFPSKYIKADDVKGRTFQVQIAGVHIEDVGTEQKPEHKPVLYFTYQGRAADKGMVLNKTNAETIAMDLGEETDAWIGHTIELFTIMTTDRNGKPVAGIRCRVIHPTQAMPAASPPPFGGVQPVQNAVRPSAPPPHQLGNAPTPTQDSYGAPLSDDIPFAPCK